LHDGLEASQLDERPLIAFLQKHKDDVSSFAVAAQFATRNPAHENRTIDLVRQITKKPVSASHQLSAKLGGPKRALTALLNARLVGMIDALIGRAETVLREIGISAPMMVVRGDGSLMSSGQARDRPIETILSGPAASIVGARWLTGITHALVSDIGGTTTDVAILKDGRPVIDPDGARVGPYRTMVEAVAMRTTGLGGDSEVHFVSEGLSGGVTLGPRRLVPVALMATEAPDIIMPALEAQRRTTTPGEFDGRFVRAVRGINIDGLMPRDLAFLERIGDQVHLLGSILRTRIEQSALKRLVERGLVQVAGVTPSDAAHVLGIWMFGIVMRRGWHAAIWSSTNWAGEVLARDPEKMAQIIVDQLTHQTGIALLQVALAEEKLDEILASHILMQIGLGNHSGILRINTGLNIPVVGLGASAQSYYPAVGKCMGCEMILPLDGGVANAIGAVVGRIIMRRSGTITTPSEGRYRVHLESGPEDFIEKVVAFQRLEDGLRAAATKAALVAGANDIEVAIDRDIKTAQVEAREVFVEATITVEASGRPRIAI